MAYQGYATRPGFWDLDEPLPSRTQRLVRAAGVGAVWGLSALPLAFGWQSCPVATFLHRPCPGCGMTRAIRLLASGDVSASLRMHPLAVPVLAVGVLMAASTVWATFALGSPVRALRTRFGRIAFGLAVVVYAALIVLWGIRALGYLGGPVAV